ncbi:MAG: hypothetical protein GY769_03825 [bacterium]|nr:hypothetical protein [bacterium]
MKKLIGYSLVFLLGVGATLGFLAWRERARARGRDAVSVLDVSAARKTREELVTRVNRARQRDGVSHIVLSETDLAALATSAIAEHPRGKEIIQVVRELRTDIEVNSLELGVSVDVSALERSGLLEAEMLERVLDILPILRGRNLYIGFRGVPGAADGKITLVEDLEVALGFLTLPVDDVAERLGLFGDAVYSSLEFDLGGFEVEEVQAGKDKVTLEVRAR